MGQTPKYGLVWPENPQLADGPNQQRTFLQQIEDLLSVGAVDLTGGTLSVRTPAADAHAASKGYVDALTCGVAAATGLPLGMAALNFSTVLGTYPTSLYTFATTGITVKTAGRYRLTANIYYNPSPVGVTFTYFSVDATIAADGPYLGSCAENAYGELAVGSADAVLAANQVIRLHVETNAAGGGIAAPASQFSIRRVG